MARAIERHHYCPFKASIHLSYIHAMLTKTRVNDSYIYTVKYQTWNHLAWRSAANASRHFCLSRSWAVFVIALVFICSTEHRNHVKNSLGWVFDRSGAPYSATFSITKELNSAETNNHRCAAKGRCHLIKNPSNLSLPCAQTSQIDST